MQLARLSLLLLLSGATVGCYLNTPIDASAGAPRQGESIAVDITDRGRVALGERLGGSVAQIEGTLAASSPESWDLLVSKVTYLREGESRWSGERVSIPRDAIGQVYSRTLSRRRTVMASAIAVGTIAALIVTRELVIRGRERDPNGGGNPNPESARYPSFRIIH